MSKNNVWIQPGTRLHMLTYSPERQVWQVWTATNQRSGDARQWRGTYMELHPNGACLQVYTSETDYRVIKVREAHIDDIYTLYNDKED